MSLAQIKSAIPAFICVLMLAGTLAGGLVQRQLSSGTASSDLLDRAAAVLDRPLAERFGNWRLLHEPELTADVVKMLRCPAYINRVYVHEQTGDRVSVAVLLGPAGPIAVHTPEICYSSQDITVTGDRTLTKVKDRQGTEHTLWDVRFQSNGVSGTDLRVLYGWSTGDKWEATEEPRFEHGSRPYLYKIQVAGSPVDTADFDPCQDFLAQFITQLRTQLVATDPA